MHAKIYDEFLRKFTAIAKDRKLGDPFDKGTEQGPQVSQIQYDVRPKVLSLPYPTARVWVPV